MNIILDKQIKFSTKIDLRLKTQDRGKRNSVMNVVETFEDRSSNQDKSVKSFSQKNQDQS